MKAMNKVMKILQTCSDCAKRYECSGKIINKCYQKAQDEHYMDVLFDEGMEALYGEQR